MQHGTNMHLTTRGASMMEEDNEGSSLSDIFKEALCNREHGILHLNYKGLVQFPPQLTSQDDYAHIQVIYAKRNLITHLPYDIHRLTGLKILYLHSNNLSSLPKEMSLMKSLESLDLSQNLFTRFPDILCRCTGLKELYMTVNRLSSLPPEIGGLKQLTILNLMDNQLESIPSEIGLCSSLETLHLDRNKLTTLPRQLITLNNLKELSVTGNNLFVLPMRLGWLPNLQHLYVDSNPRLCTIPFTLHSKQIGVCRCGSAKPPGNRCIQIGGLHGVLPSEIQVYHDERTSTKLPSTLLELALNAVYHHKDILDVDSMPKSLADLIACPTAHCVAPSGCEKLIFTEAYVHFLQIPWIQQFTLGGNSNLSLTALCCSMKCLDMFKKHPVPT
nr:leucine-rich repeat-containing protein 28-like [Lytechinus pictus]